MQIVIPMSGEGKRFRDGGYREIKPLIEVDGKPIIEHVIGMFPKEEDFIFICNKEHLEKTPLKKVLLASSPRGKIVGIEKHKFGPVYAVMQAALHIKDDEPVLVNYCDFFATWDYAAFVKKAISGKWDGGITGYSSFHPHLTWPNKYAGMRVDANKQLLEIREKHSFTQDLTKSYHSAGTYFFSSGALLKKYFSGLMESGLSVNGEYYVSSVYGLLLRDRKRIFVYDVRHFLQWGTPSDLEEYIYWSEYFAQSKKTNLVKMPPKTTLLIPMAGAGKRFADAGYKEAKPLIDIFGKPMFVHALESLPQCDEHVFVCSKEHVEKFSVDSEIKKYFPRAKIVVAQKPTTGQASTCLLAQNFIDKNSALLIAACDNKVLFSGKKLLSAVKEKGVGSIIWTFRNNAAVRRKPEAYGWVKTAKGNGVEWVFCKIPISKNPTQDHAVCGIFYYKKAGDFFDSAKEMIVKGRSINNEFYADAVPNELIEKGGKVKVFEVEKYVVLGTPDDLNTYEYWQKYFGLVGLSVVIPCYNEEKNLPLLAEKFSRFHKGNFELILVNNGSTDKSAQVLERLCFSKYNFIKKVDVASNIGYGNGVKKGLDKAGGKFLCWTHADLQADPQDVFRAFEIAKARGGNVFVKGRRLGRGFSDSFFSFGMSVFCSMVLGRWLEDINAQPNLFHSSFLPHILDGPDDFSFDLYALYKAKEAGLKIIRFPVAFGARKFGKSSWNLGLGSRMRFIKRTIDFTLNLRAHLWKKSQ
ncbi:MAG TPA: sugar phosphate nucleotidyltransferase [archaeon]|nr:sugar phosphate nucleotidyltransferase [archaeon]